MISFNVKLDKLYDNMLQLKKLDIDNYYCANLIDWFNEVVLKNIAIYKSKRSKSQTDQELFKKVRQNVRKDADWELRFLIGFFVVDLCIGYL